jgi:hypothetical protein
MPAPKQFKPDPEISRAPSTAYAPTRTKGRFAVVPPPRKRHDVVEEPVEVAVDDVTVVVQGVTQAESKYEARSLHAHVEPGLSIEIDEVEEIEEIEEAPEPVHDEPMVFGAWRSTSQLDGPFYHRRDSRLT